MTCPICADRGEYAVHTCRSRQECECELRDCPECDAFDRAVPYAPTADGWAARPKGAGRRTP